MVGIIGLRVFLRVYNRKNLHLFLITGNGVKSEYKFDFEVRMCRPWDGGVSVACLWLSFVTMVKSCWGTESYYFDYC